MFLFALSKDFREIFVIITRYTFRGTIQINLWVGTFDYLGVWRDVHKHFKVKFQLYHFGKVRLIQLYFYCAVYFPFVSTNFQINLPDVSLHTRRKCMKFLKMIRSVCACAKICNIAKLGTERESNECSTHMCILTRRRDHFWCFQFQRNALTNARNK